MRATASGATNPGITLTPPSRSSARWRSTAAAAPARSTTSSTPIVGDGSRGRLRPTVVRSRGDPHRREDARAAPARRLRGLRRLMEEPEHVASARAVYDATADAYLEFVGTEITDATETELDRAQLEAFAELVAGHPARRVAD